MTAQELSAYLQANGREDVLAAMQKLGFSTDFVAQHVLSAGAAVTVSHIAMLWMGMPNKHDRKRARQLFEALSEAGLLRPQGDDETWQLVTH